MPSANGVRSADTTILPSTDILDSSTALGVLKNEYKERDGIGINTLLDSQRNGGLTYNDFLILPGYIGIVHARIWLGAY